MDGAESVAGRWSSAAWGAGDAVPWDAAGDGIRRQVLVYGPDLMLVVVEFEPHARGAVHQHPHRQVTYVVSGRFEVARAGACRMLGPGDAVFVEGDIPHGVHALEAGRLIDVFTPARADFLPGAL